MNGERGVALFFAVFSLLLLSAIAATLILSSATDTCHQLVTTGRRKWLISAPSRGGGSARPHDDLEPQRLHSCHLPGLACPTTPTSPQLYVLNEGNQAGTVKPWTPETHTWMTRLCHDGYTLAGLTAASSDQRCTTLPTVAELVQHQITTAIRPGTEPRLHCLINGCGWV